jgi:hypothetical protein
MAERNSHSVSVLEMRSMAQPLELPGGVLTVCAGEDTHARASHYDARARARVTIHLQPQHIHHHHYISYANPVPISWSILDVTVGTLAISRFGRVSTRYDGQREWRRCFAGTKAAEAKVHAGVCTGVHLSMLRLAGRGARRAVEQNRGH